MIINSVKRIDAGSRAGGTAHLFHGLDAGVNAAGHHAKSHLEMIDLRRMHYVLKWLGPLGGLVFRYGIFRRGRYNEYYR